MKAIALALVCVAALALASIPALVPDGSDRFALSFVGLASFIALLGQPSKTGSEK